ncbi:hypothetical protein EUGRSUZ_H04571 [Eucalyptus grandis]|uniref:Uncharacterized protein n=2 Tax=Eucalyptus grandis TaxID=71139 RepID=A0ACC3JX67_EUCGR|nr:hypothetical protein EUGRSUZ_H04571 [Eucalyptus grandis]
MELSLNGNALKTFARSITCLSRVGNDLTIQASPSQISFHALNSSRSAYQLITFKPDLFDVFTVSGAQVQCSVLLKAVCSVLRTPITNIDYLSVQLPDINASKIQWALQCFSGKDLSVAVKELKAFLAFCEKCEVDIHLYFEKAGEPILMAPKFGIDELASSNFDAMLVLATMLTSQLHEGTAGPSANGMPGQADTAEASGEQPERNRTRASEIPSNHTRIWPLNSKVRSAARSVSGSEGWQVPEERILRDGGQSGIERIGTIQISKAASAEGNTQTGPNSSSLNLSLSLWTRFFTTSSKYWVDANEDEHDHNDDGDEISI